MRIVNSGVLAGGDDREREENWVRQMVKAMTPPPFLHPLISLKIALALGDSWGS